MGSLPKMSLLARQRASLIRKRNVLKEDTCSTCALNTFFFIRTRAKTYPIFKNILRTYPIIVLGTAQNHEKICFSVNVRQNNIAYSAVHVQLRFQIFNFLLLYFFFGSALFVKCFMLPVGLFKEHFKNI